MYWTGKGDDGTTKLYNSPSGCRISKGSKVIDALGSLDEVNSYLGLCKALAKKEKLDLESFIHSLQDHLFTVQAELAGAERSVNKEALEKMEVTLKELSEKIPEIKSFSVAGGTELSAHFDVARTMARRAERKIIELKESGERTLGPVSLAFINRLSSACFILARYVNVQKGVAEIPPEYD
ncbi:cob(I)yrinic acid a,c-diamide adenosyltransferase [Candidatus Giovannonibacteria bacterium]|nr:cob(I)yrinic acid a,c-diamide adenosyltransferase [Candidatus Giovannonibacteria bacterium]